MGAGAKTIRAWLALAAVGLVLPAAAGADTIKATTISDISADDGECSLREAITATNQNAPVSGANDCDHGGGTGRDTVKLPDGTLPLLGAANENGNASGDLDIEAGEGLTLLGKGSGETTIDGDQDRLLELESGELTLRGLKLSDGEAGAFSGGGALVSGPAKLILDEAAVTLSSAEEGGGISVLDNAADLIVRDSTISGNLADGASLDDGGGILFSGAKMTIDRSILETNETNTGEGGAIYVENQDGNLKVKRSVIADNHADARAAGGIAHSSFAGRLTISRSILVENSARFAGGGIYVSNDANLTVVKSSAIVDNTLSSAQNEVIGGAGIANGGTAKMTGSIVAGNELFSPGGMASMDGAGVRNDNGAEMTISSSLITANEQPEGQGAASSACNRSSSRTRPSATTT